MENVSKVPSSGIYRGNGGKMEWFLRKMLYVEFGYSFNIGQLIGKGDKRFWI